MNRALALVVGLLAVAPPAQARSRTGHPASMQRPLTESQRAEYGSQFEELVGLVQKAVEANGFACQRSRYDRWEPPSMAEALPDALAVTLWRTLACTRVDEQPSDCRPSLRLRLATGRTPYDLRMEGSVEATGEGSLLLKREHDLELFVGPLAPAPANTPPFELGRPAVSIEFSGGMQQSAMAITSRLDIQGLLKKLKSVRVLPPAAAPPPEVERAWSPAEREAEEKRVVATLLEQVFGERPLIVFREGAPQIRYRFGERSSAYLHLARDLRASLLEDFDRVLAESTLPPLPKHGRVVPDAATAPLFETNVEAGWAEFRKRYPGSPGKVTISRVGFSADRTQAMVFLGYQNGGLSGSYDVYILGRSERGWTVLYEINKGRS